MFARKGGKEMIENERVRMVLLLSLLMAAMAWVYYPGLSGGYVFDDFPNLVDNKQTVLDDLSPPELLKGALSSDSGPLNRPLPMAMLSVERYLFGLDPRPMKVTNLVIHLLNALLILFLLRAILIDRRCNGGQTYLFSPEFVALLVAGAWALAPINLTTVLYVIQRMEALATLFMLVGLLAYWRGRTRLRAGDRRGARWMWGGLIVGGGLGVLSKEIAVMLPVYALLIEWFFFSRNTTLERQVVTRLFVVLLAIPAALGLAWLVPKILSNIDFGNRPYDLFDRLWTEARVVWHYLAWIVVPDPAALSLYHDDFPVSRGVLSPWTTLPAAVGVIGLLVFAFRVRGRFPLVAFGVLWFFVMHLLVSTVLNLELVFEHRNYLASLGILLAVFSLLLDARSNSMAVARRFLIVVLVVVYGFLTFLRANEWSDPAKLAYFEATRQDESSRAQYELGKLLIQTNEPGAPAFSLGLQNWVEATRLPNSSVLPWQGLILVNAKHGLTVKPEWWDGLREHMRHHTLMAQDMNALYSLINSAATGLVDVPVEPLRRVIEAAEEAKPNSALVKTLHANFLLNVSGETAAAEALLQEALVRSPTNIALWRNLIEYQLATGQYAHARASIDRLEDLSGFHWETADVVRYREQLAERLNGADREVQPGVD